MLHARAIFIRLQSGRILVALKPSAQLDHLRPARLLYAFGEARTLYTAVLRHFPVASSTDEQQ